MKIARESWVIVVLGLADLVSTIVFIEHHGAEEANPLFRQLWETGLFAFVTAKLILLACPLLILEWARKRRPLFTLRALRTAIVGYMVLYGIGFIRLNGPVAQAGELEMYYSGEQSIVEVSRQVQQPENMMMHLIAIDNMGTERRLNPVLIRRKSAIAYMKQAHMKRKGSGQVQEWFRNPKWLDSPKRP